MIRESEAFSKGIYHVSSGRLLRTSREDLRGGKEYKMMESAREAVAKESVGEEEFQMVLHSVANKGASNFDESLHNVLNYATQDWISA